MGQDGAEDHVADDSPQEKGHASGPPDAVPDGGFRAWLQVAGTFCVYLNTWFVCQILDTSCESLRIMGSVGAS